jgi:hypothetical protein
MRITHATTDQNGRFKIRRVQNGEYRFKVTYAGNQSVVGIMRVTPRAQKDAETSIGMPVDN